MQERNIVEDLERKVKCAVPPVKGVNPQIKPCKIPYNGGVVGCPMSTAINCADYVLYLVTEREKYHRNED